MQQLPLKIDDYLKDTVVEFRFTSDYPHDILMGLIYTELKDRYDFLPTESNIFQLQPNASLEFRNTGTIVLLNENIRLQLRDGILSFNSIIDTEYRGWSNFGSYVKEDIEFLLKSNSKLFNSFTRIGLRYISHFPDVSILEKIKFGFQLPIEKKFKNTKFRTTWNENDKNIVLTITDSFEDINQHVLSILDIDVSSFFDENLQTSEYYCSKLDEIHQHEKEVFFSLLKEDFLAILNPIYQ